MDERGHGKNQIQARPYRAGDQQRAPTVNTLSGGAAGDQVKAKFKLSLGAAATDVKAYVVVPAVYDPFGQPVDVVKADGVIFENLLEVRTGSEYMSGIFSERVVVE
ncbi:hypothetical protein FACS189492_1470 [Clostridia bacterium]|nr:hypothetical protein FACS189492_1470 [Clostridia bacterium]